MNSERYLSRCPRQAKSRGASVIAFFGTPAETPMAPTRHFGGSSVCERLYCAPPARLPTLFLGFERFQGVARRKISLRVQRGPRLVALEGSWKARTWRFPVSRMAMKSSSTKSRVSESKILKFRNMQCRQWVGGDGFGAILRTHAMTAAGGWGLP